MNEEMSFDFDEIQDLQNAPECPRTNDNRQVGTETLLVMQNILESLHSESEVRSLTEAVLGCLGDLLKLEYVQAVLDTEEIETLKTLVEEGGYIIDLEPLNNF